jgi:hypothetical protein
MIRSFSPTDMGYSVPTCDVGKEARLLTKMF